MNSGATAVKSVVQEESFQTSGYGKTAHAEVFILLTFELVVNVLSDALHVP